MTHLLSLTVDAFGLSAHVEEVEAEVRRRFSHRLDDFHIALRNDGLELEGRATTYHVKQVVQQAVIDATHLRISTNNIIVEQAASPDRLRKDFL